MKKNYSIITIVIILFCLTAANHTTDAQNIQTREELWNNNYFVGKRTDKSIHSSIFPYFIGNVSEYQPDSVFCGFADKLKRFTKIQADSNNNIFIEPLLDYAFGYSNNSYNNPLQSGLGLSYQHNISRKTAIRASLYSGYDIPDPSTAQISDSLRIMPGFNNAGQAGKGYSFKDNVLYLSHELSGLVRFTGGYGKSFFGDGYRSLFLSDRGASYPFVKLETHLGNIKYVNLFTHFQTYNKANIKGNSNSVGAFHYLSYNPFKRLNISFFEGIVMSNGEGEKTGFDINYLNPIIFYRPVDFNMSSPANMLFGIGITYKLNKGIIYTQLLIDDLNLPDLKADFQHLLNPDDPDIPWGHWFNKQAFQLGLLFDEFANVKGLRFRLEVNMARPYTWSHRDAETSYSHQNQALAHPDGANFYEYLAHISYQKKAITADLFVRKLNQGIDLPGYHMGANIFQPTFDSYTGNNLPMRHYGNYIGQGLRKEVFFPSLRIAYQLCYPYRLAVFSELAYYCEKTKETNMQSPFFRIGITSRLFGLQ